jgi:type IV pilus assembly protein PilY1
VDFDIKAPKIAGVGVPYKSDVVYFGTTDGEGFSGTNWSGGGRMFRLLMNEVDTTTGKQMVTPPKDWLIKPLLDAKAPITAAANIGSDGDNFWVYFGTGRFYSPDDKTDTSQQYFFGVKEPKGSDCKMNWVPINWWDDTLSTPTQPALAPGSQGLKRVDEIDITLGDKTALTDLENYIVGERCVSGSIPDATKGIDGWYRMLTDPRERALGMPTLLGGLTTFTTYQPSDDLCTAEGNSYLYAVYALTGTAWYKNVIGVDGTTTKIVRERLGLGKGLATTPSLQVGSGAGATAYIQTSTGEIIKVEQEELPFNNAKSGRQSWQNK